MAEHVSHLCIDIANRHTSPILALHLMFPDEGELDGFYYAIFKKEKDV